MNETDPAQKITDRLHAGEATPKRTTATLSQLPTRNLSREARRSVEVLQAVAHACPTIFYTILTDAIRRSRQLEREAPHPVQAVQVQQGLYMLALVALCHKAEHG